MAIVHNGEVGQGPVGLSVHYEEPYGLELLGSRVLEGGVFEMRHRMGRLPHVILVSELKNVASAGGGTPEKLAASIPYVVCKITE